MAFQDFNVGGAANDGTGDPLRTAAIKWRTMFLEIYNGIVGTNSQTANYTLALSDAGNVVEVNSASAVTVTIPPNSAVAFPIGTTLEVCAIGAGVVTLAAGSGVTLRNPYTTVTLRAQYSSLSLRKRATDEWVLTGDMT